MGFILFDLSAVSLLCTLTFKLLPDRRRTWISMVRKNAQRHTERDGEMGGGVVVICVGLEVSS